MPNSKHFLTCVNLSQTRIDKFYESDQIDNTKQVLCDKAVAKFFICCGVAFYLISHPFFIDMVKSLCNGYELSCSTTLSNTLMYNKLTKITVDQQLTLDKESDLTLGFDGWTSLQGQSLYVFILITHEQKEIIHNPVKLAVKALEFKSTTFADCFVELIKLSQRINFLPPISDQNFKSICKGLHPMVFHDVCLNAMKLLKNMGGGENSCSELVAQIRAFTQYEKPYDLEYVLGIDNVFL
ncbi:uncharacterized protein OCT59_022514 [Rhizophagus irregularis]|uniref:uncharacterized protein n=1 Tax=Rhizophagus irregularis TaxID=588596 RepID=UPI00331DC172|nr:hypothetical protein OCT59_022514 [Rhizophagus irregularis]